MKILFVEPHEHCLFSFRRELLDALINAKHEIVLVIESTEKVRHYYEDKVKIIDLKQDLKSKSILQNISVKHKYKSIISNEKPDLILSFQVKPNIYCGMYSKNIPIVANVTGLGNMFKRRGVTSLIGLFLYKKAFKHIDHVIFQNADGLEFFKNYHIPLNNYEIYPGSGVNVDKFIPNPLVPLDSGLNFLYSSRAIKEKGIYVLFDAIDIVLAKYNNARFTFLSAEEDLFSNKKFQYLAKEHPNNVKIFERTDDMVEAYAKTHFLVLPSYYREGISNVLLESLSCERPIITTNDNPGCKEVLVEGKNGYGVKSNDVSSLVLAIEKAINTPHEKIKQMGKFGRQFVVEEFNRNIVIINYMAIIDKYNKK